MSRQYPHHLEGKLGKDFMDQWHFLSFYIIPILEQFLDGPCSYSCMFWFLYLNWSTTIILYYMRYWCKFFPMSRILIHSCVVTSRISGKTIWASLTVAICFTGIWGGKGQGKSFQTELIFQAMGIEPVIMSAGELESERAGKMVPTFIIIK